MEMAGIRWDIIFSLGLLISPAFVSTDQSGFRRFYVLQPGHRGTDRVHVSSITSRSGANGQPHTYNVELSASFGGQVRTRRMGNQAGPGIPLRQDAQFAQQQSARHTSHQMKMSGVNVCGGQCCIGWSQAPGSQRCTKPDCLPKCQNGGMCLRPQMCVCKPGSKGKSCEQSTLPTSSHPTGPVNGHTKGQGNGHAGGHTKGQVNGHAGGHTNGHTNGHTGGHTNGHTNGHTGGYTNGHNGVPQRPIPQQVLPQGPVQGSLPLTGSSSQHMTLTMKAAPSGPLPFQHHVQTPVSMTTHQGKSQKFVFKPKVFHTHTQVQTQDRGLPLTAGHHPLHAGNHTGRIKVVFTPTICKFSCSSSGCHNTCEQGNTTTIISENGHATDTLTAPNFRVVVCHLPCMNGGRCSTRDKCQCPPDFTGKFCQMAAPNGHQGQQSVVNGKGGHVHSTHTLPLTFSSGQNQGVVNIHVKHPPEASVQIHQVSEVDVGGAGVQRGGAQTGHTYSYRVSESSSSSSQKVQKVQPQGRGVLTFLHYPPVTSKSQLGRCFQETTGTQCGKAFPGLSKQDDCCGTIGTSWGFHKCMKCPRKPAIPLLECLPGYKRFNNTRCIDINECQLQGVCPNGNCINTMGSYRCSCKLGFIPDPTLTACYPEPSVVSEERGACFRLVSAGKQCLHPVSTQLSKQICCCSVGKAWGQHCERCPLPGTAMFKEICPGGMGYHVTTPYVYKPKLPPTHRHHPDGPGKAKPTTGRQEPAPGAPPVLLPTLQQPVEAFSFTERHLPAAPVATVITEQELPTSDGFDRSVFEQHLLSPGVSTILMEPASPEVVEKTSPVAPVAPVAILPSSASQDLSPTQLAEVDECVISPDICGEGVCYNTADSYICICHEGYSLDADDSTCVDVDECDDAADLCSNGHCRNTPGGFLCDCRVGFVPVEDGTSCRDVNECEVPHTCPDNSLCVNTPGSYNCHQCSHGYRLGRSGQCEDVDECQNGGVCPFGLCYNTLGSYMCSPCPDGFQGKDGQCVDIDECQDGTACVHGRCSNREGYFICSCDEGFAPTAERKACADIDECQDESVCTRGHCQNTEGSFICNCETGFRLSSSGEQCDDVDECQELAGLCDGVGQCVNNMGSYHCNCPPGFRQVNGTSCQDVDECVEEIQLRLHSVECVNTEGSFYFICESGYTWTQDPPGCEDVDECSVNSTVCLGHGVCHNTAGSFVCHCDTGYQDFSDGQGCVDLNECELLSDVCGEAACENVPGSFLCVCASEGDKFDRMTARCLPVVKAPSIERKDCYYNLNNENLCDNVLTRNVTMEECCCTLGAGWGDGCEIFPCPLEGTDQFSKICPVGKGSIPTGNAEVGASLANSYKDADECAIFGEEICKGGFCLDTTKTYECYCKAGFYFDEVKLQCVEHREQTTEINMFQSICWETVTNTMTCTNPVSTHVETTYTECCCLYGEAWGMDCALCPLRGSEDYASMCNVRGSSSNRRPYGQDALVARPIHEYEVSPEYDLRPMNPNPTFYEDYDNPNTARGRYDAFEGLRAEECGVLNGCENGRCVRVQEGYTCDCFDGYTLDLSRMACVDVNECAELNERMSLCRNAKCINTQGSYKCQCLPGYTQSDQPNYCVPRQPSRRNTAGAATE